MKNKTHIPTDNPERQHYSKKYLVRKIEEDEAKELIDDFLTHAGDSDRQDGQRLERGERGEGIF